MAQPIEIFTSDSDAWDDSALIKAWDATHELFKKELLEGNGNATLPINNQNTVVPKRKRKNKKKKPKVENWTVGERCEAKYSDDGLFYLVDIVALSDTFATVCYIDYDDEADVMLSDLRKMKSGYSPGLTKASDHGMSPMSNGFLPPPPPMWNQIFPAPSPSHLMPPPPCPLHHSKYQVPYGPHTHGPIPQPSCPPFPGTSCNDEALAAMLMSWYKTGYSTGYYQALREHNIVPSAKDTEKVSR